MAAKERREPRPPEQDKATDPTPPKDPPPRPVWHRRFWTGSGPVEVAVFERVVDHGNNPFAVLMTAVKRTYKDGDEYRSVHSFRPEDLLPLAHGLTEAFAWVSAQERK